MKPAIVELWNAANEQMALVQAWLERSAGKKVYFQLKRIDQARLLALRVWSFRYYIPQNEILDIVLPILRRQVEESGRGNKRRFGLGVSVKTLVSKSAERMLKEELRKRYPEQENVKIWRERERERQIEAEAAEEAEGLSSVKRPLNPLDPRYVEVYAAEVIRARHEHEKLVGERRRKRKPYRRNPWR